MCQERQPYESAVGCGPLVLNCRHSDRDICDVCGSYLAQRQQIVMDYGYAMAKIEVVVVLTVIKEIGASWENTFI